VPVRAHGGGEGRSHWRAGATGNLGRSSPLPAACTRSPLASPDRVRAGAPTSRGRGPTPGCAALSPLPVGSPRSVWSPSPSVIPDHELGDGSHHHDSKTRKSSEGAMRFLLSLPQVLVAGEGRCGGAVRGWACTLTGPARARLWWQARLTELAAPTPSLCTWHHCSPYSPEPKWSVNPPNVRPPSPPPPHARASALCRRPRRDSRERPCLWASRAPRAPPPRNW
jgi:hypothetical protein